jgi:hypothetical protein
MNAPSHRVVSLRVFGCAGRLGAVASLALATSASPIPAPQSACTPVWQAIPGSPPNNLVNGFGSFDDGGGEALYAGGEFTSVGGVAANRVAKWNGTAWSTLGVGVDAVAWDFANYDDGGGEALYVGGNFTSAGGLAANRVAKWSGSTWSALGTGVNAMVFALGVYDDGAGDAR